MVLFSLHPGTLGDHSLRAKNGLPDPPRNPQRGDFDFPPLDSPLKRPREGACGPPPIGFLPRLSSFKFVACDLHFVAGLGHEGWCHRSGCVDRGSVISANFLSVPRKQTHGCGARGIRERNAERADFRTPGLDLRAFLGGVGWPFFGLSKNGPPRTFAL